MARAKAVVLAGLLLACLAADVLAKPVPAKTKAKTTAVYDCPDTPRFKGCAASGCALHMHGRTSTLICAECKSAKAYVLANDGTRKAQCECAPGYAGKGQDGVCKKCPAGTDIAEGGAIAKSVCTKCPEGSYVNKEGTDCVCPAGTYKVASPDQPAGYKKMECKPCAARNAYVDTDAHSRDTCKVCTAPMLANKDHTSCVMPDSEDAAPPGDGLLDALSQSPLGGLAQAFEEGRQQVRGQRAKGENPSLKSLASRVRNVVRRDSAAAAEEQEQEEGEDEYVEVEEAPKAAKHPARKAVADDVDVEIDQAANEEESDDVTANVESTTSKHGSHAKGDAYSAKEKDYTYGHNKKEHSKHHAEEQEEKEDYPAAKEHKHSKEYEEHEEHENKKHTKHSSSKDTASYEDKDAYTKPIDKKSYYEKRAASQSQSESESQSEAEGQDKAEKQPQAAKSEPKEAVSKPQPTSGRSTFADKPEQKQNTLGRAGGKKSASSGPRKMPPTKADPEVVKQLIPGLPLEEDDEEQVASKKAATPQQPAKDAKAPAPAAAPAGPVTLKDIAKKLGAAFGATAPVSNPMGNPMGFIDPEALADAGLPPVSNVGQLMGALMKRQMADLDIGEFTASIKPGVGADDFL